MQGPTRLRRLFCRQEGCTFLRPRIYPNLNLQITWFNFRAGVEVSKAGTNPKAAPVLRHANRRIDGDGLKPEPEPHDPRKVGITTYRKPSICCSNEIGVVALHKSPQQIKPKRRIGTKQPRRGPRGWMEPSISFASGLDNGCILQTTQRLATFD